MLKFSSPSSHLVISPLLPKSRMIDSVSENGGEITGSVASAVTSFLPRMLVRETKNAKTKPMIVDSVAVSAPSLIDPASAPRYCRLVRISFQIASVKRPSYTKVRRSASKSG